jgi:hypothetical protein
LGVRLRRSCCRCSGAVPLYQQHGRMMSALPLKRTFSAVNAMAAKCQKRILIATTRPHAGFNARSSTRKLGARLSRRRRALVDRFAKSRDGGFDHSVLSWAVPARKPIRRCLPLSARRPETARKTSSTGVDKQLFFMTALIAFERAPIGA